MLAGETADQELARYSAFHSSKINTGAVLNRALGGPVAT